MDTISSVNIVQEEKYLFSILIFCVCVIVCDTRESELWTLWEGVNDLLFSRTTPPISTPFFLSFFHLRIEFSLK